MRLGLDFDGVISDTIPRVIEYARAMHGLELSAFDVVAPGGPAGLVFDTWLQLITDTHGTPYALTMPPTDGALPALKHLFESNHIVVVTARRGQALDYASAWLAQTGLAGYVNDIVSSAGTTKAEIAHGLGLAVLVDDVVENLRGLRGETVPVLWDAVYNQSAHAAKIRRVRGWTGLVTLLQTGCC